MNDFEIDQLVFSYYATVMYFVGNGQIDEAVKIADRFVKISKELNSTPLSQNKN